MNSRQRALCLFALVICSGQVQAAKPFEETFERILPLADDAEVSVRNTDGTIYLYGSERNELRITAHKRAYSRARLDGIAINVRVEGGKATIDTIYPPKPQGLSVQDRSGTVDYIILVPQSCSLSQVELVNGEIILKGLRGPAVNARLTNGILTAWNCFSALHLTTAQGRLDVIYEWWEAHPVSLLAELTQGNLRLALPPDPSLRLDAASVHGQIINQFAQGLGAGHDHYLQATIGGDNGSEFKLRAVNGNIKIERAY